MSTFIDSISKKTYKTLNSTVFSIVSNSVLEQYVKITEYIKTYTKFDINKFLVYIVYLVVLCWIGKWLKEIFNFIFIVIPNFFKNLFKGKFCFFKHCTSSSSSSSCTSSSSSSSCTSSTFNPTRPSKKTNKSSKKTKKTNKSSKKTSKSSKKTSKSSKSSFSDF